MSNFGGIWDFLGSFWKIATEELVSRGDCCKSQQSLEVSGEPLGWEIRTTQTQVAPLGAETKRGY